jgi:thiol-disulfide isomerase/thioredoxin
MMRSVAVVAMVVVAGVLPLLGTVHARAQEATACPSALWLEPAATPESGDAAGKEVTPAMPAWMTTELTDACSGETFSLADFAGKVVYVEAMATWCPPCRDQLERVSEAVAQIPEEERTKFAFVALSTETDLPREALADYAASNDFPFVFAVMPAAMLQAMADDLGQEIAVPPASPHLIVAPDGTAGAVRTGGESPEDLLALLEAAAS